MGMFYLTIMVIVFCILLILIAGRNKNTDSSGRRKYIFESGKERAGRIGEEYAKKKIREVLHDTDVLMMNVPVEYEDMKTELDIVIINRNGVFIIEVKNYKGRLYGNEDDYEWIKENETDVGNVYTKQVKNPVKQVRRQIYILAKYLENYGKPVWVNGYALLLRGGSPVESDYLLDSISELEEVIHEKGRVALNKKDIERIIEILS